MFAQYKKILRNLIPRAVSVVSLFILLVWFATRDGTFTLFVAVPTVVYIFIFTPLSVMLELYMAGRKKE